MPIAPNCGPIILISPVDETTGRALFTRPGIGALPYMGYSDDGYFAEVEKRLIKRNGGQGVLFKRPSENPTSEFLKRMAMAIGH